ncbi:uncharacterized protein LOC124640871 [Helicoverpa zea]|uniref:uncharacterized protein LOC124640871 n=1 Tax=Helicoverpa zea TaxID=7113 RepID=UPI000B39206A|nr:uncharacterized protein LOC110369619 [Helicoverpa armigera]XP_047034783.1 uncharacterized protein LOC124640871 [Helicoverpa zea]PZC87311.1 hypothetical protein B5X24_HaOG201547 [Helicoverpa armigera]
MEYFGITMYGPQNYMHDIMIEQYQEPMSKEEVKPMMEKVKEYSTLPKTIQRPDADVIRLIDVYIGRVNGFAYGSTGRFVKMKRKGVMKPPYPCDMYRLPPTTYMELGWWLHDPAIANSDWHVTKPRFPQPASPNTLILDKVRRNNKYATLF